MGKKVALIHTVKSVCNTFDGLITARMPDVQVFNTLDDFLSIDTIAKGRFDENNLGRLRAIITNAVRTGADVVCATCSTLSPWMSLLRKEYTVPLVAIDDAMAAAAVATEQPITVLATASSAIGPLTDKIRGMIAEQGKSTPVSTVLCREAFVAIKALDQPTHDALVLEAARGIDTPVIVLAQASMAHLVPALTEQNGGTVLANVELCIEQIATILENR